MYEQFVVVVKNGRPFTDQRRKFGVLLMDEFYTASQAKETGLVDDIGYLEDAINLAKKKGRA